MTSLSLRDREQLWPLLSLAIVPACFFGLSQVAPLRVEHYLVAALILVCAWSATGRDFSLVLAPLTAAGFGYELFPLFAGFRGKVLVAELWDLESLLFPARGSSHDSLSDLLSSFSFAPLDLLCGVIYLTHLPEVMGLAAFLFFRGDILRAQRLAVGFFLLNVMGWCMWLAWPAAPPWYVDQYGLGAADLSAAASAAGGARFDALVGQPIFEGFFARSTNVFGAFPSLHAGYAAIAAIAGYGSTRSIRIFTLTYLVAMCFSAVYLRHHYIVDVVAGVICALTAYGIARGILVSKVKTQNSVADPRAVGEPA